MKDPVGIRFLAVLPVIMTWTTANVCVEAADDPPARLSMLIDGELALRLAPRTLQLSIGIQRSRPAMNQNLTIGYGRNDERRLSLRSYRYRHVAHGQGIKRTKENPVIAEIVNHPKWSARYATGSSKPGSDMNSAILAATDGTGASKDQVASRLCYVDPFSYDLRLLGLSLRPPEWQKTG